MGTAGVISLAAGCPPQYFTGGGRERAAVSLRAQRGHWPRCEVTHPRSLRFSCFALRRARAQKRCSPGFPARTSCKSTRTSQGRCAGMSTRPLEFARLHKCFSALLETSDSSKAVGENGCCIQLGTGGSVAYHSSRRAVAWGAVPLLMRTIYLLSCPCVQAVRSRKKKKKTALFAGLKLQKHHHRKQGNGFLTFFFFYYMYLKDPNLT